MQRICECCSEPFEAKRSDAKTCSQVCRNKLKQKVKRLSAVPAAELDEVAKVVDWPEKADHPSNGERYRFINKLVDSVEAALEKAEKLETPQGQALLVIADRLARNYGDNASGVAALSKELTRLMDSMLLGHEVKTDALDEIAKRRRAKAAQA
jgi:hypothetical protein